jgi:hypothetical protein
MYIHRHSSDRHGLERSSKGQLGFVTVRCMRRDLDYPIC